MTEPAVISMPLRGGLTVRLYLDIIDPTSADLSAVQYESALVVEGGRTFVGHVAGDRRAAVSWRIGSGPWQQTLLDPPLWADDSHLSTSIGVDPLGYIHVAYNQHNSPPALQFYAVSAAPLDASEFTAATMGGTVLASTTYPRFYRAGPEFYFLSRSGGSAGGDVFCKRWTPEGWVDLGAPLIIGSSLTPTDNAYLGQCIGTPDGSLHLVWTHRISVGAGLNAGVFYARFDPAAGLWRNAAGAALVLPLTRDSDAAVVELADTSIGNTSLAVAVDALGRPHVAWTGHKDGHRQVFHGRYSGDGWTTQAVTALRLPRYHICPGTVPTSGTPPPSPCDLEIQGPSLWVSGRRVILLWGRTVGDSRDKATWSRPPCVLYLTESEDGGETWSTMEVTQPAGLMGGEMPRETAGLPYALHQVLGKATGPLALAHLVAPTIDVQAELQDTPLELGAWPSPWGPSALTVVATITPEATGRPMALLDKGGPAGQREFRLLLWGNQPSGGSFVYAPDHLQILLGNPSGSWGLIWYPVLVLPPFTRSRIVLTWDGTTVKLWHRGVLAGQQPHSSALVAGASRVLLGAARGAFGEFQYGCSGRLQIATYSVAMADMDASAMSL